MIDLFFWPTPNGYKPLMMLKECGLDYSLKPINIGAGDQFNPAFLKFSPNNRMPAIIDHDPADGDGVQTVFESGAILQYLAQKTGKFAGDSARDKVEVTEWLMWQMGGLGPMLGQNHHFSHYAPEKIDYAITRYVDETARLYGVLNRRLEGRDFIIGDKYTIADMACYPWILWDRQGQDRADFPHLAAWFDRIKARPMTVEAYEEGKAIGQSEMTEEAKKVLFGQTAETVGGKG
ncbi:MAG: glutathione S-transferase N-terminal domain-containing protein [Alphaproteobacteria bacterium]